MTTQRRSALIIGLGLFGRAAGERLAELGWEVAGVDQDPAMVLEARDTLTHVVELDASDEAALATLGVPEFDLCLVTLGDNLEGSILLVLNLQQLGARLIVAKAASRHHAQILRRLGVDHIVFPEHDAGFRLADQLHAPHLLQWINLRGEREVAVIQVPDSRVGEPASRWRELTASGVQLMGRLSLSGNCLPADLEAPLAAGESLVVVAPVEQILKLGR